MTVFIAWSGQIGRERAPRIQRFLGDVLTNVDVSIAAAALAPDNQWLNDRTDGGLRKSQAIVACITPDSLDEDWLKLAQLEEEKPPTPLVMAYRLGITTAQVPECFSGTQVVSLKYSETLQLINSINAYANPDGGLTRDRIEEGMAKYPKFYADMRDLDAAEG